MCQNTSGRPRRARSRHVARSQLAALGADGVEMEAEIVLAAGHALGMRTGAVLAVHAHRLSDGWLEDYDKTQRDLLRLGAMAAARAVAGR